MNKIYKINNILNNKQKTYLIVLFFLTIITIFFEVFSISLIIPVMQSIFGGNVDNKFNFIFMLNDFFNFNFENPVVIILTFIAFIYFIKSIYIQFFFWFKGKFSYNLITSISKKIYKVYLFKKINFFFNKNSSDFIKNITVETERFSLGYVEHVLSIFVEILIVLSISVFLFITEPFGFIVIMSFYLTVIFLFFGLSRKFLKNLGEKRMESEAKRLKSIQHGFILHKEISLMKKQSVFTDLFTSISNNFTNILFKETLIGRSPKIWLELISVLGLVIFLIFLVLQDYSNKNIIIISSLYAVAAFRLIPSINKIVTSFVQIKYNSKVVDLIHELVQNGNENKDNISTNQINNNIQLSNVCFEYIKNKPLLKNINLNIKKGKIVGIYGESGSGKSTLINVILGLLKITSGKIYIDNIEQSTFFYLRKKFSIVSQNIQILDSSILENITLKKNLNSDEVEKLKKIIDICCLTKFVSQQPNGIEENIGEQGTKISGGQKQRVVIARALFFNPDLLVLDEATSALDDKTEDSILNNIKKFYKDKAVVLVSHKNEIKKFCDEIYFIESGMLNSKFNS